MPSCFSIIVSQSTAHDSFSNAWSFFHANYGLAIAVPPEAEGGKIGIPFHITAMWTIEEEDREREFEWRPVVETDEGLIPFADPSPIQTTGTRHRSRLAGFVLPGPGAFNIRAQHREVGETEWLVSDAYWPFEFEVSVEDIENASDRPPVAEGDS